MLRVHAAWTADGLETDGGDQAHQLASYFDLTPSVHQSADRAYHGKITKQGNSNVRWLLVEVAHHAGRHPGPLGLLTPTEN